MLISVVAEGLGFTEGPVCLPDGRVAVTSITHGKVHLVTPGGAVESIVTGGGPNGMALGPDGVLYVAQNGGIWGAPGSAPAGVQMIREGRVEYLVEGLGAPNDLVVGPDGRLWVTDSIAGFTWGDPDGPQPGAVFAVDPRSGACDQVLGEGPRFTNGIAFAPAGDTVLLTATTPRAVVEYTVTPRGLVDPRTMHVFAEGGPDGMAADGRGRYWVALTTAHRIALLDPVAGEVDQVELDHGSLPTNVCRDHDGTGLYVTVGLAGALLHLTPEAS